MVEIDVTEEHPDILHNIEMALIPLYQEDAVTTTTSASSSSEGGSWQKNATRSPIANL